MIRNFKHRGLQRLFERGDRSKIRPDVVGKVERVLARLDASGKAKDMDVPGFGLHAMTGYTQRAAACAGLVFVLGFIWLTDSLDVIPDVWTGVTA